MASRNFSRLAPPASTSIIASATRTDGDGDDLLVGELADLAGTARADMGDAAKGGKDVREAGDDVGVAAGHDRQAAGFGADDAARDRRIDMGDAARLQAAGMVAGNRRGDRTGVDDDGAGGNRLDRAAVEQHRRPPRCRR